MTLPDLTHFGLRDEILREPGSAERIILWVPGVREGRFQSWDRIATIAGSAVNERDSVCVAGAMLLPLKQRIPSFVEKLWARIRGQETENSWVTPEGGLAEPTDRKRTDVMLVWSSDDSASIDDDRIREHWPNCEQYRRLGTNLFAVVGGIEAHETHSQMLTRNRLHAREENFAELSRPENNPLIQAETKLADARVKGDQATEATALTDLGAVLVRHGDAEKGVAYLERGLALARQSRDAEREYDVLANLGIGYLAVQKVPQAVEILQQVLNHAQSREDRFTEKMMLNHLGVAHSILFEPRRALDCFETARNIARQLGDRRDQAELSWSLAVCHDELGQRELALQAAQTAVEIFGLLESPQAVVFSEHLAKFRRGQLDLKNAAVAERESDATPPWMFGGPIHVSSTAPAAGRSATRPSLLRMAYTAARSMTKFVASGFKTVSREANEKRLEVCGQCEHHTGVRCKLCGCFTAQKAWMPHEHCPVGKWPV